MNAVRDALTPWMRGAALASLILIAACSLVTSWNDVMKGWVGNPIEDITKLWGQPDELWVRNDGKTIYKYHAKDIDPSCFHYWIVNDQKVIEDFYYEGYCRPIG